MKRLVLIALALAAFVPATAHAAVPCRDRIYNDWYGDGKIATTYPISCYRDAIKHVHADAATYSSLLDDIRSAMQAAIQRLHDKTATIPAEVGKGGSGGVEPAVVKLHPTKPGPQPTSSSTQQQVTRTTPVSTIASGPTNGGSGGGVPTPILILGGLALLLAAVGAAGAGAKRFRRRPGA